MFREMFREMLREMLKLQNPLYIEVPPH